MWHVLFYCQPNMEHSHLKAENFVYNLMVNKLKLLRFPCTISAVFAYAVETLFAYIIIIRTPL